MYARNYPITKAGLDSIQLALVFQVYCGTLYGMDVAHSHVWIYRGHTLSIGYTGTTCPLWFEYLELQLRLS